MPSDRLSALDATFLALDSHLAPLHVGWTMRFDGQAPPLAQLRRHLDARLSYVPNFRRRVARAPLGLGDARWADDPGFDVARHTHRVTLAAPGGSGELRAAAGRLLSAPLDPQRPLWRVYLVDGLDRGFALVGQAHHALVDGIAAIEVAALLFGPDPGGDAGVWAPAPTPGATAAPRAAVAQRASLLARAARGASATGVSRAALRDAGAAIESLVRPVSATSFEQTRTPRRHVAYADVPLDAVRAAGRRHHATINDVLLAACSLALGRALRRRGDGAPDAIKVLVPVSTRGDGAAAELGNKISFMAVELPIGETDAVRVLRTVRDRTTASKRSGAAQPLDAITRAADVLPAQGARAVARAAWRAMSYSAIVSNVPGPPVELSLLGRPLRAVYPAVPVPEGQGLTIGALSYGERLHVGLTADAEVVPDARDIARDVEAAFDRLRVEAPAAPTPWRAKARAKRAHLRPV